MACRHRVFGFLMAAAGLLAPAMATAKKPVIIYKAANWQPDSGVITVRSPTTLYGTAMGSSAGYSGEVFEFDLKAGAYSTLHEFNTKDAFGPSALILGPDGQLYGTVVGGPKNTYGALFTMNPKTGKTSILYRFPVEQDHEALVTGAIAVDRHGVIYGTTSYGGPDDVGTVFRFDPATKTYVTVHDFSTTNDCFGPGRALIFNSDFSILYGTAAGSSGFGNGDGCVFSIQPQSGAESVLAYSGSQGITGIPNGLLFDGTGQLFVTADDSFGSYGQVFRIDPMSGLVTLIYRFQDGADGAEPSAGLQFGSDGALYGTTDGSDSRGDNNGTAYRLNVTTDQLTSLAVFNRRKNTASPIGSIVVDQKGDVFGAGLTAIFEVKH
jgi:uncharacterized repeat protein (TIGR03803 family)